MAKLIVTTKALAGLAYELGDHWVTIGRAATNKFQVPEASVSGQHCEACVRGAELLVRDMRSTNGTFINGTMITEGKIKLGESFRIGEVDIWFEPSEPIQALPKVTSDLPAAAATPPEKSPAEPAQKDSTKPTKKRQVLLVDDSMAFLETIGEMFELLSHKSWEIHKAAAADQALNLLQQHPIELAVVDINMPMLDGVQLLGVIQRRHPDVKKVVLTGHATDPNRANSLAHGAELFLEKPVTANGIVSVFNLLNDLFVWSQREGFSGTLRQVGLTDVIQIECLRRSSCILEVHNPDTHGAIYIESGTMVHATTGMLTGEKALFCLLGLRNGEFRLKPFLPPSANTIQGSWEYLLMEAARMSDEAHLARPGDETVMLTKLPTEPRPMPISTPAEKSDAPVEDTSFKELGDDIVVISTYDGKWHSLDGTKR